MNYDKLKDGVKEIAEVAASVPERFQDKCFELLLSRLLRQDNGEEKPDRNKEPDSADANKISNKDKDKDGKIPTTTQLRVLMKKTSVTEDDLNKIILFDNGEVHFIKEPKPKGVTTGQMEWALLLALKNAITKNALTTDPEDVRSVCQEKGYYDKGNFAGTFKRNAKLFKKALAVQGPAEALSSDGQDALGELVKRLASEDAN